MQYTQYDVGQFYSWHNDAGIAGAYKPATVGNRSDGLAQDFVNENIELVRKLSFVLQLSDPDDYEVAIFSCWMKVVQHILLHENVAPYSI